MSLDGPRRLSTADVYTVCDQARRRGKRREPGRRVSHRGEGLGQPGGFGRRIEFHVHVSSLSDGKNMRGREAVLETRCCRPGHLSIMTIKLFSIKENISVVSFLEKVHFSCKRVKSS